MRVSVEHARAGDIVLFKGKGIIFKILSSILWLFNRWWDVWAWHIGVMWTEVHSGWMIMESLGGGVQVKFHPHQELTACRIYRWLGKEPSRKKMAEFEKEHLGASYDIDGYIGTGILYLLTRLTGRAMGRFQDDDYFCWELICKAMRFFGKPLLKMSQPVMITSIVKKLEQGD